MLKKEINSNTKIVIYKMIYIQTLIIFSESWTELTRCKSSFAGMEMWYYSKQEETE
jgi:hypothetical protein